VRAAQAGAQGGNRRAITFWAVGSACCGHSCMTHVPVADPRACDAHAAWSVAAQLACRAASAACHAAAQRRPRSRPCRGRLHQPRDPFDLNPATHAEQCVEQEAPFPNVASAHGPRSRRTRRGGRRGSRRRALAAAATATDHYAAQHGVLTALASYAEVMASQAAPLWQGATAAEQLKLGLHGKFM
jgi:hypothetical protein